MIYGHKESSNGNQKENEIYSIKQLFCHEPPTQYVVVVPLFMNWKATTTQKSPVDVIVIKSVSQKIFFACLFNPRVLILIENAYRINFRCTVHSIRKKILPRYNMDYKAQCDIAIYVAPISITMKRVFVARYRMYQNQVSFSHSVYVRASYTPFVYFY